MGFNSKRLSRWLFVLVVVAATIYFLYRVRDITMPFILGGLIAYLLYRPVRFIERQGLGRVWAILLLYMLIISFGLSFCQEWWATYGNGTTTMTSPAYG